MNGTGRKRRVGAVLVLGLAVLAGACIQGRGSPPTAAGPVAYGTAGCEAPGRTAGTRNSSVDEDEVRRVRATHVEELLSGRVAGVRVISHPGGGFSVRIRGNRSFLTSNEPLYVVDGMPIGTMANGAVGLSTYDIQCIEVLKDAGSTSMYGVRGANGVVLITTRRPT